MNDRKFMAAAALAMLVATAPAALAKNTSRDAQFTSMFEQFDRNHDGVLSRTEFPGDALQFGFTDRNRDGEISRAEARRIFSIAFRRLDRNRDGVLSEEEVTVSR